jgi:hypothetical protein
MQTSTEENDHLVRIAPSRTSFAIFRKENILFIILKKNTLGIIW